MIILVNDRQKVREIDLSSFGKDVVSFGRQSDCDIVLNTDTISRVHGAFYYDKGVWIIEDLQSKNGISVDGGKVKRATAKVGREFILYDSKDKGKVSFTILKASEEKKKSDSAFELIQSVDSDDGYANDYSNEDEKRPKSKKKTFVIFGAVAAVAIVAVAAILFNIDWKSKEEKAYYEYLAELVEDADDASEINIIHEREDDAIYYNYYAIDDFDGDKADELFILKEIGYGESGYSIGEFYEYVEGEVQLENSFDVGSDVYPFTFYNNGIVKAGVIEHHPEFDSEICYAGVHKGFLEDIGFLPLSSDNRNEFKAYDAPIIVEYNESQYGTDKYMVWSYEWEEMTALTGKEYEEIFEFDAEIIDVDICYFDIEVIADMNGDKATEYEVYEKIDKVDEYKDKFDGTDELPLICSSWFVCIHKDGTGEILDYYGPNKDVKIPEEICGFKITGIEDFYADYAEKVTIPEGVELIGDYAFQSCDSIAEVIIPESVRTIEEYAFAYCGSLEKVVVPEGVEVIEDYAFCGNDNLTVELPESLKKLHKKAIGYCPNYDGGEDTKDKNCTIIGEKGSIAEEYAKDNGFNFEEKK